MGIHLTETDIGKKFRTRGGRVVTLEKTSGGNEFAKTHPFTHEYGATLRPDGYQAWKNFDQFGGDIVERVNEFDPTKPVQTRDGREARILCANRKGIFPIVVLINDGGYEMLICRRSDGTDGGKPDSTDLVNVPEKRTRVINMYPGGRDILYFSRQEADKFASADRIACVEVTYEIPVEVQL